MLEKQANENNGALADNKSIAVEIAKNPDLKKYNNKTLMSFVQMVCYMLYLRTKNFQKKDEYGSKGIAALESASPFDQAAILLENEEYIVNSLSIYKLRIVHTDEDGVEQTYKDCVCPMAPLIIYPPPAVSFCLKNLSFSIFVFFLHF